MKAVPRTALILGALAVAGAVTGVASWWRANHRPIVLAGVVEVQEIHVGSKLGGRITEVPVQEGDNVAAGAVVVRFEMPEFAARRDQLAAALAQAQAVVERWENGPRKEEIEAADAAHAAASARLAMMQEWTRPQELDQGEAELAAARAELQLAEATWKRVDKLQREKVASPQEADDARMARDAAAAKVRAAEARVALLKAGARSEEIARAREDVRQAKAQLDLLRAGTRPEQLAEARAKRDEVRAALAEAETQLREGEVRAPCDCRVEVLAVRKGDLVAPGKPVARLLDLRDLWVKAYCPEPDLGHCEVGGRVTVGIDSFPDRGFAGIITQIAGQGEFTPRNIQSLDERWNQVFAVKVQVDGADGLLKPGMAALVTLAPRER